MEMWDNFQTGLQSSSFSGTFSLEADRVTSELCLLWKLPWPLSLHNFTLSELLQENLCLSVSLLLYRCKEALTINPPEKTVEAYKLDVTGTTVKSVSHFGSAHKQSKPIHRRGHGSRVFAAGSPNHWAGPDFFLSCCLSLRTSLTST